MIKLTWDNIQKQSDEILSDGLFKLKSQAYNSFLVDIDSIFGNYLISLDKIPYYIGEARELSTRLNQQSKTNTSTFYKNYQKLSEKNKFIRPVTIDNFRFQFISTSIGRKEIEEFGIVNLPTLLNRFQLDKRTRYAIADHKGLWESVQQIYTDILKEGESKILNTKFVSWFDTVIISYSGLYLVKDKLNKLIYVGESSNIGERIIAHSGLTYFSALRRHIGTEILKFELQEINGKKRYFKDTEDKRVTEFLRTCKATVFPVSFGRYELEEYLIRKQRPLLNRKDNKD